MIEGILTACLCVAFQTNWIYKEFTYEAEAQNYIIELPIEESSPAKMYHKYESTNGEPPKHIWVVFYPEQECIKCNEQGQ